jgi:flagellar hook-length control protein FliK
MIQQVAKTVEASIQQGRNTLHLQLNPADLGAIDIRLVSSGHRVSMTVIAEQASTGRMLESQVEQLRQNLADAGVQLSQMHVSQQDAGGSFGRGFAQQQQSNPTALRQAAFVGAAETESADERQTRLRTPGQVDYRI